MNIFLRALYLARKVYYFVVRPVTLGVRVLMVEDGRVLLVKHSYEPYWYLVGGGVERRETLEEGARREAREEAGAELGELHLFGVYTNYVDYRSDHIVLFSCEHFKITSESDFEIEDCRFFSPEDLPENTAPGHALRICEYLNGGDHPQTGMW